jgi:HlyD family secretion protein
MILRTPIALLLGVLLLACSPEPETTRIVGQLESDRIVLSAESPEPIVSRLVREGQSVEAGQELIQQDPTRTRAQMAEVQAALAQAQARLDELIRGPRKEQILAAQANLDGSQKNFEFRRIEFDRAESLLEQKLASQENRDTAKAALDIASAKLEYDKVQLQQLLTGTTVEELEQARAAVGQAQARLQQKQIDLQRLTIKAPVNGVVDSLPLLAGERPVPGQPVVVMLSGDQPYARVYIPEVDRVEVRPGIKARVFVDGRAEPIPGHVRWVASDAAFTPYFALTEHDRGRLTYLAKINLETTADRLPDGVPVEVDLLNGAGGDQ